jgi:hypothetical protein
LSLTVSWLTKVVKITLCHRAEQDKMPGSKCYSVQSFSHRQRFKMLDGQHAQLDAEENVCELQANRGHILI